MPSVKSYQNRLHDIQVLQARVRVLESQLKSEQENLEAVKKNYNDKFFETNQCELNILKAADRMNRVVTQTQAKIIDALSNANRELERKVRIYRSYIRNGQAFYPEHHTQTIEIPSCLKPLDVLEYIGKKIENGPDNLSQ